MKKYSIKCMDCSYTKDLDEQDIYESNYETSCPICGGYMNIDVKDESFTIHNGENKIYHTINDKQGQPHLIKNEIDEHFEFMNEKKICKTEYKKLLIDFKIDLYMLPDKILFERLTQEDKVC